MTGTRATGEPVAEPGTGADADVETDVDTGADSGGGDAARAAAERIWRNLGTLVRDSNDRRKATAEALGMSFFRIKVLRRIAAKPSGLSELATRLGSDRPYVTLAVDDLVKRGLVERNQHPTDRRCKIVSATPAGQEAAARANAILGAPPPALLGLPPADLEALDRIAAALAAGG
jgi:DNA-binding MarR family transcriptional regulator